MTAPCPSGSDLSTSRPPPGAFATGVPPRHGAGEDRLTLNVVIVYGDVPAAQQAVGLVTTLAGNFTPETEVRPTTLFWRFDLLAGAFWQIRAKTDALNAQLLFIATSRPSGFPGVVARWLKLCLAEKRETPAALVALLGPADSHDGPESPRLRFLERSAATARLDFFAPRSPAERGLNHTTLNLQERERAITPTLGHILDRSVTPA